jgi:hypothetical protein
MAISVNVRHIGGSVLGKVQTGDAPMPWIIITVATFFRTWDQVGRRPKMLVRDWVCIQGSENVKKLRDIREGTQVYTFGQAAPVVECCADSGLKGTVTLASTFQIVGPPEEE